MKKTMMTCSWVLALCLLAPLGGCAEDPDDLTGDTTQALVEDDAQIEGTADGETSPGGALRLPACNQSQLNQAIQHATGLLGVDQMLVNGAGILNGFENGVFGDFVKNNALDLVVFEFEGFFQMPGDGFSLAVVV